MIRHNANLHPHRGACLTTSTPSLQLTDVSSCSQPQAGGVLPIEAQSRTIRQAAAAPGILQPVRPQVRVTDPLSYPPQELGMPSSRLRMVRAGPVKMPRRTPCSRACRRCWQQHLRSCGHAQSPALLWSAHLPTGRTRPPCRPCTAHYRRYAARLSTVLMTPSKAEVADIAVFSTKSSFVEHQEVHADAESVFMIAGAQHPTAAGDGGGGGPPQVLPARVGPNSHPRHRPDNQSRQCGNGRAPAAPIAIKATAGRRGAVMAACGSGAASAVPATSAA